MIERIRLWHAEACQRLIALTGLDDPPSIDFAAIQAQWWAYYCPQDHTCRYDLTKARVRGEGYQTTVVHEVCHGFQKLLGGRQHDATWRDLMVRMGQDPDTRCAMSATLEEMYGLL